MTGYLDDEDLAPELRAGVDEADRNSKRGNGHGADRPWPELIPLEGEHIEPEPYPVSYLPPVMLAAVTAYQAFGQQPVSLVACSAMAAASVATQGLCDVARDRQLVGPASLNFLIIAESGERKTSADGQYTRGLKEWQAIEREMVQPELDASKARVKIWQAKHDGLLAKIRSHMGKETLNAKRATLETQLLQLTREQPHETIEPSLFAEDITAEKLAISLATGWPTRSLWSDEGGIVIGSHAMGEERIMRFLGLLNRLWDGGEFNRERSTRESATIKGRRFCVSLMAQPDIAARLFTGNKGIARAAGFLARFLLAYPPSTIGWRPYDSDLDIPELRVFADRLITLLRLPLPTTDSTMALKPPVLQLSPEAFKIWKKFHNEIEGQLRPLARYAEFKDLGAKTAEQAARIAAVLHVFQHGPQGTISAEDMDRGTKLAGWHLTEGQRVLTLLPVEITTGNAKTLLEWLAAQLPKTPTPGDVLRLGPYRLRDKKRRDKAIEKLVEHGIARVEKVGNASIIVLNPQWSG